MNSALSLTTEERRALQLLTRSRRAAAAEVKLDRRAVRRLRKSKRSVVIRVTAQLRDGDGNVTVTNRRMRVDLRR